MGTAKWIAGLLGWVAFGPIGALLGVIAGSVIEGAVEAAHQISGGAAPGGAQGGGYRGGYGASEQRNSFLVSLLVLSFAVIRSDGKTLQAELDYVKAFVRQNFGEAAYRRMAMKNHPDKVASLGPDVQKAAEEKFRKIQEAYETIKKQRGIK